MRKFKGFTLIEILMAVSLVMLFGLAWAIKGQPLLDGGRFSSAQSGASTIAMAITTYKFQLGKLPTSLSSLKSKEDGFGPWIDESALTDPWNNEYKYSSNSNSFAVWSCGADGKSNSSVTSIGGDDAGVINEF